MSRFRQMGRQMTLPFLGLQVWSLIWRGDNGYGRCLRDVHPGSDAMEVRNRLVSKEHIYIYSYMWVYQWVSVNSNPSGLSSGYR